MSIRRHLNPPRLRVAIALGALLLGAAAFAQAPDQSAAPPSAAPEAPAADPSAPAVRPGFLDAFGRLIEQSVTNMNSALGKWNDSAKGASDAAKTAAEAAGSATKEAAGSLVLLPMSRMITGRERCDIAPNGAPDCAGAVLRLCKANSYTVGRSMDVESAENCPANVMLARRLGQPEPAACQMESFVTKVLCQ